MYKSYYVLKLLNKNNLYKLYHLGIRFIKIKYLDNYTLIYLNINNYKKIEKYLSLYELSIYKTGGLLKYKLLIKNNYIFLISIIISIIMIFILSKITFSIKILTDDKEIIDIINHELDKYNLKKYRFIKSYEEKEKIKNKILNDYKDKIEWLEIDRIGTKYYIKVLERIINNDKSDNTPRHIIAKRNATIKEIKSSTGEIIKKINDYVNVGDIIISGNIKKGDEIKNKVKASGQVFGETWYNVRVELPKTYISKIYTNKSYKCLTIDILNKRIYLFNKQKYNDFDVFDKTIISNNILPFSINSSIIKEIKYTRIFHTYDTALIKGMDIAKEKLLTNLDSSAKILLQKKLKLYEENNIIIVEVFFKVYEDITDYEIIMEGDTIDNTNKRG